MKSFPQQLTHSVSQKDEQPHNSQIIQVEQGDRFAKIEEYKMRLQKQVCGQIPAEKGEDSIERHRPAQERSAQ